MGLISLIFLGVVLGFALLVVFLRWLVRKISPRPSDLGPQPNGQLKKCPPTPNCVCSHDPNHLGPIEFAGTAGQAIDRLLEILEILPRNLIIEKNHDYLWVEFRSYFWGFLDDVEFLVDEEQGLIHFRAAARLGKYDFGANQDRLELIKSRF